jgi:hypothetical protein
LGSIEVSDSTIPAVAISFVDVESSKAKRPALPGVLQTASVSVGDV